MEPEQKGIKYEKQKVMFFIQYADFKAFVSMEKDPLIISTEQQN